MMKGKWFFQFFDDCARSGSIIDIIDGKFLLVSFAVDLNSGQELQAMTLLSLQEIADSECFFFEGKEELAAWEAWLNEDEKKLNVVNFRKGEDK
jgi:hypothetical protein